MHLSRCYLSKLLRCQCEHLFVCAPQCDPSSCLIDKLKKCACMCAYGLLWCKVSFIFHRKHLCHDMGTKWTYGDVTYSFVPHRNLNVAALKCPCGFKKKNHFYPKQNLSMFSLVTRVMAIPNRLWFSFSIHHSGRVLKRIDTIEKDGFSFLSWMDLKKQKTFCSWMALWTRYVILWEKWRESLATLYYPTHRFILRLNTLRRQNHSFKMISQSLCSEQKINLKSAWTDFSATSSGKNKLWTAQTYCDHFGWCSK